MKKNIHSLFILLFVFVAHSYAQDSNTTKINNQPVNGYYQKIDLNPDSPCNCDKKTDRTYELNRGLIEKDVLKYQLHAYKFILGNSMSAISKLFKAFENDPSIYKISMKEWESFMLLTTPAFDQASFEKAAATVLPFFAAIPTEDFLKVKNTSSYNEYIQALELEKKKKAYMQSQQTTH
ncbi:MAG: hypothetical protein JWN78_1107 [Bacteroidota bacterium]|nr:hypothetical protein [Bacteroidota bacterium]